MAVTGVSRRVVSLLSQAHAFHVPEDSVLITRPCEYAALRGGTIMIMGWM
jgi:hypothetical protein